MNSKSVRIIKDQVVRILNDGYSPCKSHYSKSHILTTTKVKIITMINVFGSKFYFIFAFMSTREAQIVEVCLLLFGNYLPSFLRAIISFLFLSALISSIICSDCWLIRFRNQTHPLVQTTSYEPYSTNIVREKTPSKICNMRYKILWLLYQIYSRGSNKVGWFKAHKKLYIVVFISFAKMYWSWSNYTSKFMNLCTKQHQLQNRKREFKYLIPSKGALAITTCIVIYEIEFKW
jgi:hypothetical protein